uniref:Uncharacterized protein n=1 Tax=Ditylenchus dipsaci TaxID=166011 RepID=A0A915CMX3_9BILA
MLYLNKRTPLFLMLLICIGDCKRKPDGQFTSPISFDGKGGRNNVRYNGSSYELLKDNQGLYVVIDYTNYPIPFKEYPATFEHPVKIKYRYLYEE